MPASSPFRPRPRAVLVSAPLPRVADADVRRSLDELAQLARGLGFSVADVVVQRRASPDPRSLLGAGKLAALSRITGGPGVVPRGPDAADDAPKRDDLVVIVDDELDPSTQRHLRGALGVEVLDRSGVILRVFDERARSREAKLEIELARLVYDLPRVRDDRAAGDREGGGGRAARGHTNVELAKQRVRERMAAVRAELARLAHGSDRQRAARAGARRVALVGYTNAGKSSLMRALTGSDVLVADQLFATLGTTVRALAPPGTPPVLVADTVGFVDRLPHALVASFRSTLAEAREASLLLHVVDGSDPAYLAQRDVTEATLRAIGAGDVPTLLVANKADRLDAGARAALADALPDACLVSARDPARVAALRARVLARLGADLEERAFVVPWTRHGAFAELRGELEVAAERAAEPNEADGLHVVVRGAPEVLARLAARLAADAADAADAD